METNAINQNGKKMLKVSSIVLIVGSVIAIIAGIVGVVSVGAIHALMGEGSSLGPLYAVTGLALASGIFGLVAGIVGLGACKHPEKAGKCIVWGIIVILFTVASQVLSLSLGEKFDVLSIAIGLLLPAVYIVGANQLKKATDLEK